MRCKRTALFALTFLALPSIAAANAGTPLMWVSALHLLIGNAVIGLIEGGILVDYLGAPKGKTVVLLVLANYFSSWIGGLFLGSAVVRALPLELHNAWLYFWCLAFATYLMTLVLEFPFIGFAYRGDSQWFRKSIIGTLVTQTASYAALFGIYWLVSGTTLYTRTETVELSRIPVPEEVVMYYIAAEDGNVYKRRLPSTEVQKVYDLRSKNRGDRLFVSPSQKGNKQWDVVARLETDDRQSSELVTIIRAASMQTAPSWRSKLKDPGEEPNTWFNMGSVSKLGSAEQSQWDFRAGFWAGEGLHGTEHNTGQEAGFSYETLFGSWYVRNATLLPGDKVLLQLGSDQICIYDPLRKMIALVTKGRGPVAVIEKGNVAREQAGDRRPKGLAR